MSRSDPRMSSARWRALRQRILMRDAGVCRIRGSGCTGIANTVDHIIPISEGGAMFDPANLRAACAHCNYSRHHPTRFRRRRATRFTYRTTIPGRQTRM